MLIMNIFLKWSASSRWSSTLNWPMRNCNGMTIENMHHTLPDGMIGEVVTGDGSCLVLKKTIFDIISLYFSPSMSVIIAV